MLTFAKDYCLPQIAKSKELAAEKEISPYICFYNGLSLLSTNQTGVPSDVQLLEGFQLKKKFTQSKPSGHCSKELRKTFAQKTDALLPIQSKYSDNTYIDIYQYFCKKQGKINMQQVYANGLELQQKLDKIIDYDFCNEDQAKSKGFAQYCFSLF